MWSSIRTRSPGPKSGFTPPVALVTISTRTPSEQSTRAPNATSWLLQPS